MSKIEVDAITEQSGTTLTVGGGSGKTLVADAATVTLGRCGGTVALASGASQTGFGRTGAVDWQTTKKTTAFTAANGEGYFVDTAASGAVTMTLPSSPSAGNIVAVKDYNGNFANANLTIGRNGSPINGASAVDVVIDTAGASIVLVYVDATQGWVATQDDSSTFAGEDFITASGGTETTCGNDKIHTFTGPGTFTVSAASSSAANNVVSYVIVGGAGGGGGGAAGVACGGAGGGGAGGYREVVSPTSPYSGSPLDGYPSAPNRVTVTATAFPITVGAGGAGGAQTACGSFGATSTFSTITAAKGGYGGAGVASGVGQKGGGDGGSGGGGGGAIGTPPGVGSGGTGNVPPVSPAQGTDGGTSPVGCRAGGSGGGATAAGGGGNVAGGAGATSSINGTPTARAGGGGNGRGAGTGSVGGAGGGGNGNQACATNATPGTVNTGGGGGGAGDDDSSPSKTGGNGGSGIVIIRYKFQ